MSQSSNSKKTDLYIVILGESGVGKTSLTDKVLHDNQYHRYDPFLAPMPDLNGSSDRSMTLEFEKDLYHLEFADISLTPIRIQEHGFHAPVFDNVLRRADGIVLLYDVTNKDSYREVTEFGWGHVWGCRAPGDEKGWNNTTGHRRFGCVLVGNKIDLVQGENSTKREVPRDLAEEWASMVGVKTFEVDRFDKRVLEDVMWALVQSCRLAERRDQEDIQMRKDRQNAVTQKYGEQNGKGKRVPLLTKLKSTLSGMRQR